MTPNYRLTPNPTNDQECFQPFAERLGIETNQIMMVGPFEWPESYMVIYRQRRFSEWRVAVLRRSHPGAPLKIILDKVSPETEKWLQRLHNEKEAEA